MLAPRNHISLLAVATAIHPEGEEKGPKPLLREVISTGGVSAT